MNKIRILIIIIYSSLIGLVFSNWVHKNVLNPSVAQLKSATGIDLIAFDILKKLSEKYHNIDSFYAEIKYEFTDELNPSNKIDFFDGIYLKANDKEYIKSYNSESIVNKDFKIVIDHEDSSIYIIRQDENSISTIQGMDIIGTLKNGKYINPILRKVNDTLSEVSYRPNENNKNQLYLYFNPVNLEINESRIILPDSIEHQSYGILKNPVLCAIYSKQKIQISDIEKYTNTSRYVNVDQNTYKPVGAYSKFHIESLR